MVQEGDDVDDEKLDEWIAFLGHSWNPGDVIQICSVDVRELLCALEELKKYRKEVEKP